MVRKMLRLPAMQDQFSRSRSALLRDVKAGLMPKPVSIGARAVGWPSDEADAILDARIAGKSDQEIRELVAELEAARQGGSVVGGE